MIFTAFQSPQVRAWQQRLSRIPKWGWIAIGIGVILPLALMLLSMVLVALISGGVVLAGVLLILWIRRLVKRIGGKLHDDGRRNVRIMVRPTNKV